MSIRNKARSALLNIVTSDGVRNARRSSEELKRKIRGGRHVVTAFVELDDPYSYLLCRYLPELAEHYDVDLDVRLCEAITEAFRPAPELYSEYAMIDCERLARELGIPFLDRNETPPVEHRRKLLDALAGAAGQDNYASDVVDAVSAYWRGDSAAVARRIDDAMHSGNGERMLAKNRERLEKLGHYNTAMLNYGGEWYWGVDRLHYLVERLESLDLLRRESRPPGIASIATAMQVSLPVRPPASAKELPALELFYSFRSPYSWLALSRILDIVDAFGMHLKIRPVLPMVMRGMQVPKSKLLYIAADSSREARRNNVPFRQACGPGRCRRRTLHGRLRVRSDAEPSAGFSARGRRSHLGQGHRCRHGRGACARSPARPGCSGRRQRRRSRTRSGA